MAFLPVALAVGGAALQGLSSFQQSNYQAQVAKNNAKIAGQNADRASYAAQVSQMRSDREYQAQGASILATQAASGLDVLGASQVGTRINEARVRAEQATDIRQQGLFDVRNYQQQQANYLGEAHADKVAAWMGVAATAFQIGGIVATKGKTTTGGHSLIGGTG